MTATTTAIVSSRSALPAGVGAGSDTERPAWLAAVLVAAVVLAGYVFTLAPSVTFWDAGELIAASHTLGVPHPPGTPLFVLIGHVWGTLLPVGEFAWRTNLLSALFSAAAAGLWFLVLHEAAGRYLTDLEPGARRALRIGGAAAGALVAAFTFTNWQNSTETETYSVATFTIAAVAWLAFRWRAHRGTRRAAQLLLLIGYLFGLSIGNHLLALLVGPAVLAFLFTELWIRPAADPVQRRAEWAHLAVIAGLWALLIGVGLGNTTLSVIGGLCFLGAAVAAAAAGQLGFALVGLGAALVGVTPYLLIYIRAGQHPMINESAASTWDALLGVIRREQYPVRTPLDDPTEFHGPDNPGRSLTIIGLQLLNYLQYFDWQWARSLPAGIVRTLFSLGFLTLGLRGLQAHWRSDRAGAWLLLGLFLVTGLGLVGYMNFKPGYSLAYDRYPDLEDHEVRERDYFFVVSFVVWGCWAGLGLLTLIRGTLTRATAPLQRAAPALLLLALVPLAANFRDAGRRHGPDARLAGDFAYDLLNSAPPYGVLFTYGDNDTFPLWWAQEVERVRRDVVVVCLALAETDWYMRQLRDYPLRDFEEDRAPAIWRGRRPVKPSWPLHTMTDAQIDAAMPQLLGSDVPVAVGPYQTTLRANTAVYSKDILSLRVIQQNFGRRPVVWSLTAGGTYYGLERFLVQRGIGIHLEGAPVDTTAPGLDLRRLVGVPLDLPVTERLMTETYRYADLLKRVRTPLESTSAGIAGTLGLPFTQLALAAELRGDQAAAVRYLELAARLSTNPLVAAALDDARRKLPSP